MKSKIGSILTGIGFVALALTSCDKSSTPTTTGNRIEDSRTMTEAAQLAKREDCAYGSGALPVDTLGKEIPLGKNIPIDHFVLVQQENRSFDHYYARLKEAGVSDVDAAPIDASNPDTDGTPMYAYHETQHCIADVNHEWEGSFEQWNGGKNDGFVTTNNPNGRRAMGYFDESDLPYYYGLAKTFAIGDQFFSSLLGPTFPNRMYYFAASSYGIIDNGLAPETAETIFNRLEDAKVEWRIYYTNQQSPWVFPKVLQYLDRASSISQFYEDAAAGTLPAVSIVEGRFNSGVENTDEHPPASHQKGQQFVSEVVAAMFKSPQWARSAVILSYDEHGGYYDHVSPPAACPPDDLEPPTHEGQPIRRFDRLGFRVPLIVVSPWSKPAHVSHVTTEHTSILRLIEARFGLPALTRRDANSTPITDLFDFSAPHFLTPPQLPEPVIDEAAIQWCRENFGDGGDDD